MGYALANAFADAGADVVLITGPSALEPPRRAETIHVHSAAEMYEACNRHIHEADIAVFAAAVADFTPEEKAENKIKKSGSELLIRLKPTVDIAGTLGKSKRKDQLFVGFALETDQEEVNALGKLKKKNFDFIVLNSLNDMGAGFGVNTNKITIIDADNNFRYFELKSKREVANDIIDKLVEYV